MVDWGEILAALGGTVLIAGGVSAVVSKFFSDRFIESHKSSLQREVERLKSELTEQGDKHRLQLKKQVILFTKELEACAAYMKLHREIAPSYSFPDMDWHEACAEIAKDLRRHGERLETFMTAHAAALSIHVRQETSRLWQIAENNKFESGRAADKAAGELLEGLGKLEDRIIRDIRSWEVGAGPP